MQEAKFMKIESLEDTAPMMVSADYKARFKAEYYQLTIRMAKLDHMLKLWDKNELSFTPTCPRELYDTQIEAMRAYADALVKRSALEGVVL